MKRFGVAAVFSTLMMLLAAPAQTAEVWTVVSAKDSVYFAGHTDAQRDAIVAANPTYSPLDYFGDLVDLDTIPGFVDITGLGPVVDISATGSWTHGPCCAPTGPEGKGVPEATKAQYGIFGISLLTANLNMLVGVFLDSSAPVPGAEPAALSTVAGDDMTTPLLAQSFAIGASLEGIVVPTGATRLFLGMHDGFEWTNNSGSVSAHISSVPEPGTVAILGLGLMGLAIGRRRRST